MSFLVKSPSLPQAATNAQANQQSTWKQAEPVTMHYGRIPFQGAHWLSDAFNRRTASAGKTAPAWQYLSIAAGFCIGPARYINRIRMNGAVLATLNYTRSDGEDYTDFTFNPSLALGQASGCRVYWGTETQSADSELIAGTGQDHPPYRGLVWILFRNLDLGQGTTSVPSLEVEIGRETPAVGSFAATFDEPYGVNPFAAIYNFLLEQKGGLGISSALLDASHWAAQAAALESAGIGTRTGNLTYMHPVVSDVSDIGQILGDWLSYVDGYVRVRNGQLQVGWFPNRAPDPSGLTELTEDDLVEAPKGGGFSDWNLGASDAIVTYLDTFTDYAQQASKFFSAASRRRAIAAKPLIVDRPLCHAGDQAAQMAAEAGAAAGAVEASTTLRVKRARAVNSDGTPLRPGDLFVWNYAPNSLELICRVQERQEDVEGAVTLTIARERGAYPRPYVAPADPRVLPTPVDPGVIDSARLRLWFLSSGFGTTRQVTALYDRSSTTITGLLLSMSASGAAPWETVLNSTSFASKCLVDTTAVGASDATVRVSSSSIDFARYAAQSTLSAQDDTLCILIDDEVLSVSTITVVSAGVYTLGVLRGRQGTAAAAHAVGHAGWLFYRSEIHGAVHLEFSRVNNGSGVYDATVATKYFKVALYSNDQTGLAKPDDPGLSLTLPPIVDGSASYTVGLTLETIVIACDSSGTPNSGELGAGGRATTVVVAAKGAANLTPVASSPGVGQFSIALGTLVGATATKTANDTVRADSMSADAATIPIVISLEGMLTFTRYFTLAKAVGGTGTTGPTGNHTERRYKRSTTTPSTPTGDNPSGWTVALPTGADALWASEATKTPADTLVGVWSTPVRLSGNITFYPNGNPATVLAGYALLAGDNAYDISDGNKYYRWDGSTWVNTQRVLDLSDFGLGISPIPYGTALPNPSGYTGPKTFFNQTDGKLYRYVGGAWTNSVPAADITAGTLAAGVAYIGNLNADQVTAGTFAAGLINASSIGTAQIITSSANIANAVITSAHISSVDAGSITGGTINAAISLGTSGSFSAGSGFNEFRVDGTQMKYGTLQITNYSVLGTMLQLTASPSTIGLYGYLGNCYLGISNGSNVTNIDAFQVKTGGTVEGGSVVSHGDVSASGNISASGSVSASGNVSTGGDIHLGSGGERWIYDGYGNRILRPRYSGTPTTLSDVIDVLQYHGLSN